MSRPQGPGDNLLDETVPERPGATSSAAAAETREVLPLLEADRGRVILSAELPPRRPDIAKQFIDRGPIGRGGTSEVREAIDRSLLRVVAIKNLRATHALDPRRVQRFVWEAQITGQLEHPSIVPIHEFGVDEQGQLYLCMKRIQGETLTEAVTRAGEGRLEPDQLSRFLQAFLKVCDAVAFAHSRGIIHRDLKPANIMLGDFGQVYVVDWGLARHVSDGAASPLTVSDEAAPEETNAMAGTPAFMAPEQARNDPSRLNERTDIFGLGAILYFIVTGRPPFDKKSALANLARAALVDFPPPRKLVGDRVPLGLERIVLRAMECEPEERYQSVEALRRQVEAFLCGTWHLEARRYEAGELILREGEFGEEAFIIESGRCLVYKGHGESRRVLREMGPREVFGETGVLSHKARTATVEALEPVVVMVVTGENLSRALGVGSWVGAFVTTLVERFRELDAQLDDEGRAKE